MQQQRQRPELTAVQVVEFIQSRRPIYERILTFEAVDLDELQAQLRDEGNVNCSKALLAQLLDERGVMFTRSAASSSGSGAAGGRGRGGRRRAQTQRRGGGRGRGRGGRGGGGGRGRGSG